MMKKAVSGNKPNDGTPHGLSFSHQTLKMSAIAFALALLPGWSTAFAADPEVVFFTPNIVRVTRTMAGAKPVPKPIEIVTAKPGNPKVSVSKTAKTQIWRSEALTVRLDRRRGTLSFVSPSGVTLLAEASPAKFEPVKYTRGYSATKVSQHWLYSADRPLYGLGNIQNERLNQRHSRNIRLFPDNIEDGIPCVCGVDGSCIYWDNVSQTVYDGAGDTFGFESQVGARIDYYFIAGGSIDGAVAGMRHLTGQVPMNALWSYGYWQSRDGWWQMKDELLNVLRTYRERRIPFDGIVQDWKYWLAYKDDYTHWNAMEFRNPNVSDPKAMMDEVHARHAHSIFPIWCNFGSQTKPYAEMSGLNGLLPIKPGCPGKSTLIYDAYNPAVREVYWKYAKRLLDAYGPDGWWMDVTEPLESPFLESDLDVSCHGGRYRDMRLAYPICTVDSVYRKTREARPDRRTFILTRSATAGLQRTGAHFWSGDMRTTWTDLARQIPCGQCFSVTGNPNWSNDIGGYNERLKALAPGGFDELYVRWMQSGVFQAMMRSHGRGFPREFHYYGKTGDRTYDALVAAVKLRYRLLPYIYSLAHDVTARAASFIRPLVADFPQDRRTWDAKESFLFGRNLLVRPVTRPDAKSEATYLPETADWWNYFTGERHVGGRTVEMPLTWQTFPLYVRAGSIIPYGPDVQYVDEKPWDDLEVVVYPGADGAFTLYEDEGDGYGYEQGRYTETVFRWNDAARQLTVEARRGAYPGMLAKRRFRVKLAGSDAPEKPVAYDGHAVTVRF